MSTRIVWIASLSIAFAAGTGTGALFGPSIARAEQKFGPKEVQSVPESFVLGGNKEFAVLSDLLAVTLESQERLEGIERNTAAMVNAFRGTPAAPGGASAPPSPPAPR